MQAAREAVLRFRVAPSACNTFSNFYLACLGQVSWNAIPSIPPEIILLAAMVLLPYVQDQRLDTDDDPAAGTRNGQSARLERSPGIFCIDELFVDQRERHRLSSGADTPPFWSAVFGLADIDRPQSGCIASAVHHSGAWQFELASTGFFAALLRTVKSATDGLGAIFPPMVYIQIALNGLGWDRGDPVLQRAEQDLDAFFLEKSDETGNWIMIQPCFSPVWDTGYRLVCVDRSVGSTEGDPQRPMPRRHGCWRRSARSAATGPKRRRSHLRTPAQWYFEYHNAWYPDVDDTAHGRHGTAPHRAILPPTWRRPAWREVAARDAE